MNQAQASECQHHLDGPYMVSHLDEPIRFTPAASALAAASSVVGPMRLERSSSRKADR